MVISFFFDASIKCASTVRANAIKALFFSSSVSFFCVNGLIHSEPHSQNKKEAAIKAANSVKMKFSLMQ